MRTYFEKQIDEIRQEPRLRIYGSFLALLLVLSSIDWLHLGLGRYLARGTDALCWPMLTDCASWRLLSPFGMTAMFAGFLLLGAGCIVLFLIPGLTRWAYWSLLALNLVKLAILALDFRMRLNQHIMAFWITLVFLLIPRKEHALKIMVVLFYFWAGLLKFSPEWLSGSALYKKPWFFGPAALPWACGYVLVLETVISWGLLLEPIWAVSAAWVQLCVFHLFSFAIVGFFYPTLMYSILAIFPLLYWKRKPSSTPRFLLNWREAWPTYCLVAVFSMFQLVPRFMPGDTAITGEGRLFSLHMFDSYTNCEAHATIKSRGLQPRVVNMVYSLAPRIQCDPIVYLQQAQKLCKRAPRANPFFTDLDLSLRTRRSNERDYKQVIDVADFCSKDLKYSVFSHNDWIRTE